MNAIFSRRVVVESSSRFTKLLTNPVTHSHHNHQLFTSLYKPNQSRHFQSQFLPSGSSSPLVRRFDPSLLWRSEKIRGFLGSALRNNTLGKTNLGILVESRVGIFGSLFPRKGFEFEGFSRFQRRGWKYWLQGLSANDVVLGLVIANVTVFGMWRVFDTQFMTNNFMISLDNFTSGRLHTLISSAFSHIDIGHIFSNMIGLYFFGTNIANTFGSQFLLKLYLAGALGGSVFYLIHHAFMATSAKGQGMFMRDPSRTPALGASGAVNAIMLLEIFLNPKATIYFEFFIPLPAMLIGIFLIGKDLYRITEGDSNISGSAHLGGAAVAAIAWARIRKGGFRF